MIVALVLAAGSSTRYGRNKLLDKTGGENVWVKSCRAFLDHPQVDAVGLVASADLLSAAQAVGLPLLFAVQGGASRQESSLRGLEALPSDADIVLIHDAARPFVSAAVISRVIEGVQTHGAAFPALPVTNTIKVVAGDRVETLDRSTLVSVQTPQGASRDLFLKGHSAAQGEATDDMALLERIGVSPLPVEGDPRNIKLTYKDDLMTSFPEIRTGFGYDIHAFSTDPNRPLWLGGVEFDSRPGLEGHSDADALIHAVVDALLGAAALGDIGQLFPNTDPRWKNAPSRIFLEEAGRRIAAESWTVSNIDCSVVAERPKVMRQAGAIRAALAEPLGIDPGRISVKATTNEGLGALGRAEGIAATAVATLVRLPV
jgi:2-C-methyl-D-erythritol 4-phosphate cytidylyltransferase/2-C-methyl-D-erythritol 2,4-cyclodiphosphate synthase